MAYCKECGAYIPDGRSKCFACGFDSNEAATQAQEEAAEQTTSEEERAAYEEQRRRRQQQDKAWAEAEQRRRKIEMEFEKHRKSAQVKAEEVIDKSKAAIEGSGVDKQKVLSILSYLGVLFILPYLLCGNDEVFARYHAKQGLILFIFNIILDIVSAILPIGWLVKLFSLYCIYKGITNVLAGVMAPLPYIGNFGSK